MDGTKGKWAAEKKTNAVHSIKYERYLIHGGGCSHVWTLYLLVVQSLVLGITMYSNGRSSDLFILHTCESDSRFGFRIKLASRLRESIFS